MSRRIYNKLIALMIICSFLTSTSAPPQPGIVSEELVEVSTHVFSHSSITNQSGERLIIDALLFDERFIAGTDAGDTTLLSDNFSFVVPHGQQGARLCVDLASRSAVYRRMSVFELKKSTQKIHAHLRRPSTSDIGPDGAVMVVFSTTDPSRKALEACLLQSDWIFPARHNSVLDGSNVILQLRLNSGNGESSIVQVDENKVAIGGGAKCSREYGKNGMFDRICRLSLAANASGTAAVKIRVRQRSGPPMERFFRIAVSENAL